VETVGTVITLRPSIVEGDAPQTLIGRLTEEPIDSSGSNTYSSQTDELPFVAASAVHDSEIIPRVQSSNMHTFKFFRTNTGAGCALLFSVLGCSADATVKPMLVQHRTSALMNASGVQARAESGELGRGEQDLLVRLERQLPGFGGLYIADGAVRVHVKSDTIPLQHVRAVLSAVYSAHPNAAVREAMSTVSSATTIPARYALSELIAIQERVEESVAGWNSVGTRLMANNVVVSFPDSSALLSGLNAMPGVGVPLDAITAIVMPPLHAASNFSSMVRPTRAGLQILLENSTYEPLGTKNISGVNVPEWYGNRCSLGFNVQTSTGANYFLTAGHCENGWRGVNGITGDSVFQPTMSFPPAPSGFMGTIAINPAWKEGSACPIRPGTDTHYDFCTTADVALGVNASGIGSERKVGVSDYEGDNGYPGTDHIHNWYSITRVLPPEYVDSVMRHQPYKSGGTTYTTAGPFIQDMTDASASMCWPANKYGCGSIKWILWQNVSSVHADADGGDSGAPVFTGDPVNGAPYAALGILVAAARPLGIYDSDRCSSCYYYFARWDQIEPRVGLGTLNPKTTIP
jgi:hypothetical protein